MSDNPRHERDERRRVRYLGSAKSGTSGLQQMRLTSLALIPLTFAFVWIVISLVGKRFDEAHLTLSRPLSAILFLLFIGTGIHHMQLGMRTIIEDYVHGERAKDLSLAGNVFFAVAAGVACAYAVLRLSFG